MEHNIEAKFEAAVKLIQSMPKDGPFSPSTHLQLRFYSLYKQATDGPCNIKVPSFFNIVAKAKYDAWKKLEDMSKEEAMKEYIEELKRIVETMSFTEDVADFLDTLGPFYEIVYDNGSPTKIEKLEEILKKNKMDVDTGYNTESKNSPTPEISSLTSTNVQSLDSKSFDDQFQPTNFDITSFSSTNSVYGSVYSPTFGSESSDEEFLEPTSFDDTERHIKKLDETERKIGKIEKKIEELERTCRCDSQPRTVEDEVKETLRQLRQGLEDVKDKVLTLESSVNPSSTVRDRKQKQWPLLDMSLSSTTFIVLWPFVAHFVVSWLLRKR
ncbi:acyl-CoA-binding domain-containing protein 5-like [Artemia franciscana]|uniref:ACB domain-containing protein n=1 Tax=Artemia franciscana TaxID=6661 RepID=A0AA88INR2_ARTSF|nr:hypothetical protein QYM36_007897 [Artemia franciscana]KAK2727216.1 hypothetical protein QYM36_007897 [Artemia franciscana]